MNPPGQEALARRLDPQSSAPIAVAYSGGGDSLAALLATRIWAVRYGRRVVALHVDHRLQPASGDWARTADQQARALGLDCRVLPWIGDKPRAGLPAAARQARHRLIANAARDLGASVIIFGHTADDQAEGDLMRDEGASLGRLREWRPSPVWPDGRGLFLLRPLLDQRRAVLRRWLVGLGHGWIDDPANEDPASTRARARLRLAGSAPEDEMDRSGEDSALAALARSVQLPAAGAIVIERSMLSQAAPDAARRLVSAALLCAGGGDRPPRRQRLQALLERLRALPERTESADFKSAHPPLRGDERRGERAPTEALISRRTPSAAPGLTATLAGATVCAREDVIIAREAGAFRRQGNVARLDGLTPGDPLVWDGRFLLHVVCDRPLRVGPAAGFAKQLPISQRRALAALPREMRAALPVIWDETPSPTCPILAQDLRVIVTSLVAARFLAACGVISKESEI